MSLFGHAFEVRLDVRSCLLRTMRNRVHMLYAIESKDKSTKYVVYSLASSILQKSLIVLRLISMSCRFLNVRALFRRGLQALNAALSLARLL